MSRSICKWLSADRFQSRLSDRKNLLRVVHRQNELAQKALHPEQDHMQVWKKINYRVRSREKQLPRSRMEYFEAGRMRKDGCQSITRSNLFAPACWQIMADDRGNISRHGALVCSRVDQTGCSMSLAGMRVDNPYREDWPARSERALHDRHQ